MGKKIKSYKSASSFIARRREGRKGRKKEEELREMGWKDKGIRANAESCQRRRMSALPAQSEGRLKPVGSDK